MTGVVALGVRSPTALPYLIGEGILPHDPPKSSYSWDTFNTHSQDVEEEVLRTEDTVVYSSDGYIRLLFRFDKTGQKVRSTLLANFPRFRANNTGVSEYVDEHVSVAVTDGPGETGHKRKQRVSGSSSHVPLEARRDQTNSRVKVPSRRAGDDRALVIVLEREMQIHFLSGPAYTVHLPFEVVRVYAAQEGLLIQRKAELTTAQSSTLLSQSQVIKGSSLRRAQIPNQAGTPLGRNRVSIYAADGASASRGIVDEHELSLSELFKAPIKDDDGEAPKIYSLTDPLGEFCALSHSTIAASTHSSRLTEPQLLVEYDDLGKSEEVIYVSDRDELRQSDDTTVLAPLLLLVTVNRDSGHMTIWQGWYLRPQSLSSIVEARAALKASRARRRTSHVSLGPGTGVATPAARHRDRTRESLAASIRLPNDTSASKRKTSQHNIKRAANDEEAMASQMDPDFQTSQDPTKGSRRISSLLSRGDLSTADPARAHIGGNAGHGGPGRRGTSFGAADRRSLGASIFRKSRGSTPGSVFSKSVGFDDDDDDTMEVDGHSVGNAQQEEVARVQRLFLATQTSTGLESALDCTSDGSKQEFVVREVHSFPLDMTTMSDQQCAEIAANVRVYTLLENRQVENDRKVLSLFVANKPTHQLLKFELSIAEPLNVLSDDPARTSSETTAVTSISVPLITSSTETYPAQDIVKIGHESSEAIVYSDSQPGLQVVPASGLSWRTTLPQKARWSDPSDTRADLESGNREVGRTRLTQLQSSAVHMLSHAPFGHVDLSMVDGHRYRLQLILGPHNPRVSRALNVCRFVLSGDMRAAVSRLWIAASEFLRSERLCSSDYGEAEWQALIVTMFSFAVGSLTPDTARTRAQRTPRRRARRETQQSDTEVRSADRVPKGSAWAWLSSANSESRLSPSARPVRQTQKSSNSLSLGLKGSMTEWEARTRQFLHHVTTEEIEWLKSTDRTDERRSATARLLFAIHLLREEWKLLSTESYQDRQAQTFLAAALAQMGHWLQLDGWNARIGNYYEIEGATDDWVFSDAVMGLENTMSNFEHTTPPSIFLWIERALLGDESASFPSLGQAAAQIHGTSDRPFALVEAGELLPRTKALRKFLEQLPGTKYDPAAVVELMDRCGLSGVLLETLPEAVTAPIRDAIAHCQSHPNTTWRAEMLQVVGREDLLHSTDHTRTYGNASQRALTTRSEDIHTVFALAERSPVIAKTHEVDRHAVILQIFAEDRRYVEASRLTNPSALQVAECAPRPEWSDMEYLEQQKRVMQWVMTRTMALSPGNGMVHFESQRPLLSEKFHVPGFSMLCQMKPMDNTISADRTGFTEEKLSWAFFHAGVSAGLHISRKATGIDTSWIVFNRPAELTNRHAGFLLALGLNGHLRTLAKWLAFKYLTPKHTMTSIGLLLGLSASYLGTMDSLITRMLSVHISRMLPAGAAELNVSPLTQTAGLMGIGLLYFNTQHRRMSEIMLSEIESQENDEAGAPVAPVRDESYRLGAGFALGFINIGKGLDLQGLHGMGLLERLLSVAVGSRPVERVHVVDKAIAGAVMAIALIFMKTGDKTVARKIDVPDTLAQLDHVRPDILLLRSLAKNLIMWDEITDEAGWIRKNLPRECSLQYFGRFDTEIEHMARLPQLISEDIPVLNVIASLGWSLSLKFAGSGNHQARDEVLSYLKLFTTISKQEAYYYDALLTRNTVRRCIDLLALSAATIMAGTGDIDTFRYLRRLHGRTDASTTYGSHLAVHLAVGTLFLGGGTYTFGTSNLAVASLLCAFYPLFPSDVLDNAVHLQALRHLWVFAAEPRCIVALDQDTQRPIPLALHLKLRSGETKQVRAPCLLPELQTIVSIRTDDPSCWPVTLDLVANPEHLASFRESPTLHVRRAPAQIASPNLFSSSLALLNEAPTTPGWRKVWQWFLKLESFRDLDEADLGLILPPVQHCGVPIDQRGTVVDDRLALSRSVRTFDDRELWNLRILFVWAEAARNRGSSRLRWLDHGVINKWRAEIEKRMVEMADAVV